MMPEWISDEDLRDFVDGLTFETWHNTDFDAKNGTIDYIADLAIYLKYKFRNDKTFESKIKSRGWYWPWIENDYAPYAALRSILQTKW